MLKQDK